MLKIARPSMALNAVDVPGPDYDLGNNYKVAREHKPEDILNWVAKVAREAPDSMLKSLVFNCHGKPGKLKIGTGIGRKESGLFSKFVNEKTGYPLVRDIYIVACRVAMIKDPGQDSDGNLFCGEIAKNAKARVYVSTVRQTTGVWPVIPAGYIDGFEGTVYVYKPDGSNAPITILNW